MLETPPSRNQSEAYYASQREVPTIICPICDAVYAPSLAQAAFWQVSPDMLESAFMSMCHFCFRCRRPACPQCWDCVHGVCGDCVREANLAFRAEAAPLDGMLFRPLHRQEQGQQEVAAALLTCVKPGHFLQDDMQAHTVPTEAANAASGRIAALWTDLRERVEDRQHTATPVLPTAEASQPVTGQVAIAQTGKTDEEDRGGGEGVQNHARLAARAVRVIERVLTVLALVLLLAIIALVIIAQASDIVNTAIFHVLHVDIRAEVAYLVRLIQQLRQ